jgi:hypothetical protein
MGIKYTDKEFKEIIYNKFGNKFTIIDVYTSMKVYLNIKCNKCKTIRKVSPERLMYKDNPVWCDECTAQKIKDEQIQKIKDEFPKQYPNGLIIYLDDVLYFGEGRKRYWLNIHDNDNYKYQLEYGNIITRINSNDMMRRFFQGNPFTSENIQNFLNINNINLKLLVKDLCNRGATKPLEFIDKNYNKVFITWNNISNNPTKNARNIENPLLCILIFPPHDSTPLSYPGYLEGSLSYLCR